MYALQNADAVTTNASILAKKAKAFVDREIHIIPNGIDTNLFKPMERNEVLAETLDVQRQMSNVIGFVGELREKKGLATLLIWLRAVDEENIPFRFLLLARCGRVKIKSSSTNSETRIPNIELPSLDMSPTKTCPLTIH
jgi:glycosyltransferase involved in cell wall biosynthesis